jgi:multiple sugar transport system ATP-binding protein
LVEGRLVRSSAGDFVDAMGGKWPVDGITSAKDGQRVVYGIRPTDLRMGGAGAGVKGRVEVIEPTGAETEVVVEVGGQRLVLVHPGRTDQRPDADIGVNADPASGHVFDHASGVRLN